MILYLIYKLLRNFFINKSTIRAVALRQTDTRYSDSVLKFIPYLVASKLIATAPPRDPCAALAAYFLCTDLRTKKMLQEFTHNNILVTIRINQHYMNKHFLSVP